MMASDSPYYTFRDEFDGPAGAPPDPRRWSFDLGGGGWGNNELQIYTDSRANSFLDGAGHLVIRATSDEGETGQRIFHSARIKTQGKFAQRLGHWEARIKVTSARGFWPAWWMLGDNITKAGWPACGELDMLEDFGYSTIASSVHSPDPSGKLRSFSVSTPNDNDFHVFGLDWSPDGIAFSRDGKQYGELPTSGGMDQPPPPTDKMFMLLNLAVGGNAGEPPRATPQAEIVVDYVRAWE
jgi:beta-glucanase (GH16 family)